MIYIIRHCEAEGQAAEAPLTEVGFKQADELSDFLSDKKIERIITSPFLRATQSIDPFAKRMNIEIETDTRLAERVLSTVQFPDWLDKLQATFTDMDLKYEGGESSNEARERIAGVVSDILESDDENTVIVAHGGIISVLLNSYDARFGFKEWKRLSNPDVYQLSVSNNNPQIKHLWKSGRVDE